MTRVSGGGGSAIGGRRGSVVIAGAVARRPGRAGHAWAFLQYVLGFRRLGWDVLWLDAVDAVEPAEGGSDPPAGATGGARGLGPHGAAIREFQTFTRYADIADDAALLVGATGPDGGRREPVCGLSRARVLERVRGSDLFINVMGYIRDEEILGAAPRTLFLDIDPGFGQMWEALGLARMFHDHDAHATVGLGLGEPDCHIPTLGLDWIASPPPVVLDRFGADLGGTGVGRPDGDAGAAGEPGAAWTSVVSWRGPFDPIEYEGRTYGLRVHEFRKFTDLPARTGERFRIALDIDPSDAADRARLLEAGWQLADPADVAADLDGYRRFISTSAGEILIAKGLYVQSRSGWFSDRSTCYLASGRPVVAQDTGWSARIPSGRGLFAFEDVEEATAAIEAVRRNPVAHRRGAREVAEAFFDSDLVLGRLVERATSRPGASGGTGARAARRTRASAAPALLAE